MKHLGEQFGEILGRAREHGIETVPEMPGMVKVGGLHVPMSYGRVVQHDNNSGSWAIKGHASFTVPDERGNVFDLSFTNGGSRGFSGSVKNPETGDFIDFTEPEQFEKLYGNMAAASPGTRDLNMEQLDADRVISGLIGRGPGEMVGVRNDWSKGTEEALRTQEAHILDPHTGDLRGLDMPLNDAVDEWSRQYDERHKRGGEQ